MGTRDLPPYIEQNKSRHGTVRYYLRMGGKRICRLPDDPHSEQFSKEYWNARNSAEKKTEPAAAGSLRTEAKPNSFKWLCLAYMRSKAFKALDHTTQSKRRSIIEKMWVEPLTPTDPRVFADIPLAKFTSSHVETLRDRKRDAPFAADERLKVLRQVFDTKRDGKPITVNVARGVEPFAVHSDGHATASPDHLRHFIMHHGVKSKAALALAIMMFTGFRVSDIAQLGPKHRRGDEFHLRLYKNRNRSPVDIVVVIHPILDAVIGMHKTSTGTYLVTEFGKPYSVKGLGNRISEWFNQAGLLQLSSHSVRKGLATDVAYNSATDLELEAMFGWRDGKTSKIYTRNAERARLARQTVSKINWDGIGHLLMPDE